MNMNISYRILLAAGCLLLAAYPTTSQERPAMHVKKLTPILFVDSIENCLPFWVDRLGFERTIEVPEGDHLGFVALASGAAELMLQTWGSVQDDFPAVLESTGKAASFLYLEVTDIEETTRAVEGFEVVVPQRDTFYGARELVVREPGGHLITFAQLGAAAEQEAP